MSNEMSIQSAVHEVLGEALPIEQMRGAAAINVNDLVTECRLQPYFYGCAASLNSSAQNAFRKAKAELELTKALVETEIRQNPEKFGLNPSKVTEGSVQAQVLQHPAFVQAKDIMLEANKESDLASVLVEVFEHKRSMLNNEVQLCSSNYNQSGPPSSRKVVEDTEDRISQMRRNKHGEGID